MRTIFGNTDQLTTSRRMTTYMLQIYAREQCKELQVLLLKNIDAFLFFTDSSLQASQKGTKTQGVTKKEEKRIEAKESDTSTTRPRCETAFDE